jgi:hypothetical protein
MAAGRRGMGIRGESLMVKEIPFGRIAHGNEHWQVMWAMEEIEVYCGLLDHIDRQIATLDDPRGTDATTLRKAQALLSSYAFEIGMKSIWALDHPGDEVPKHHNLLKAYDDLSPETIIRLEALEFPRSVLTEYSEPFVENRYSMEPARTVFCIYTAVALRGLVGLLCERLEEVRRAQLKGG